ncbi:hypothetical protein WA026_001913 [Henosepilachna vigintioctopunctata]|uniref:Smoothelin domain-containing protein n=1 Tax=Henosepilachna vigintioctopunctata TaxID=420089 RepID=A0AAW1URM7_9CUCU
MSGETEYTDKYKKKLVQSKHENNNRQNTITDIENFNDLKTDTSPHVRVHRIDDRTNKTKSFNLKIESNDGSIKIPKKIGPLKKPSDDSPKSKTFSGNKVVTEKTLQSTKPKPVEPVQHLVKETKPSTKVKHTVSTTIVLNPKTTTSKVVTVSSKNKKDTTKPITTSSPKKEVIDGEESDDESIPDSLDETIQNSVNNIEINKNPTENKINSGSNRSSPERKSPTRNYSQPDFREEKRKVTKPKLEKRCISTKSIIINNADRGITVDLQRSISSREPTPDRVCPLPVTSDDEGNSPRFPDKVVEPDDITSKRSSHRLFETVIQENDDGKDSQRIVEITEDFKQKVTEVDKVDRDDDSLLTVNKKINKFLTTADKLTEKPIMDISQPAPKVERQKFEITEDLREDHCLLSVSDKVNKFINEAEYLTSHNNSQPRKSVNIDNRSDITKKVTLTPELRVNQESPSKPSDKKYVPKNNAPFHYDSNQLFDRNVSTIQQDVFITTECDQIEKEEDSFRSTKHPQKEPEGFTTTSDTNEKRISNFKPYSRGSKSPDKFITDTSSAERGQSTETIRKTEKDIEHFTENEQLVETPQNKKKPEESSKTFTPKNRRPSQEEKIILSTVGRLRSNESIKKAKALFENKSSSKEFKKHTDVSNNRSVVEERNGSIKEITRRPIDRSSLTPKRLDFPTSDDRYVEQSTNRNFGVKHLVSNQHKVDESKVTKSIVNTGEERDQYKHTTLRKQQSPQREIMKIKSTTRGREPDRPGSKERDIPGYMKPLERNISPVNKSLNETETLCTHEGEKSIPGYMKPLDRTTTHRSPQRDDQHPYITHEKPTYEENREEIPGYMKPLRTNIHKEHHHSSRTDRKENILLNESSQAHESISTIHHKKSNSNTSAMHQTQSHVDSMSTENLRGYMKPLKQHIHQEEYSQITNTHRRHGSRGTDTTDELPGYMKPLLKHNLKVEDLSVSKTHESDIPKGSIHSDDIPGYMNPIHSHSHKHEHTDFTETEELSDRIIHSTNKPRASIHSDDIPGYMKPIHSHSHNHEHTDFTETEELSDTIIHSTNKPRASIHSDDIPGYMKPIHSHSHKHEHTDFTETEELSGRIIHDTNKPRLSIHSDDIPGYMKPIISHSHLHEQTDSTHRDEISNSITHNERKLRGHSPHKDISPSHDMKGLMEPLDVDEVPGYMKPLDRANRPQSPKRDTSSGYMKPLDRTNRPRSPKRDTLSGYMKPLDRADRPRSPKRDTNSDYMKPLDRTDRPRSPKRDTPSGYMKPVDRADRPCSPKRETNSAYIKPLDKADSPYSPKKDSQSGKKPSEPHGTSTKFGVTLKKTDSMRGITTATMTPKKHPILSKKNITEEEIEEIFELEVLEELLLIVTGYELRRQIRTQIRTVKKLIAEDKLEVTIRNIRNKNNEVHQSKETTITEVKYKENNDKSTKKTSQLRTTIDNKHVDQRDIKEIKKNAESFENTSSYSRKDSTSSLARSETTASRSSKSPERISPEPKSPSRLHAEEPSIKKSFENNRQSTQKTTIVKLPEEQKTKLTNIFKSTLKKTENITKGPVNNIQPEWTSQRNLKKVTTNDNVKKVVNATNKSTKKEPIRSSSPSKEVKSTDVITSSYGVGPTDENGTPLFGLKALRAQNKSINTKVQGTVVSSQYYSETGKEPIGQISVTKYSSDPKDLGSNENLTYQDEGILSITTTQKFGFDDAPSLKQLTNSEGDIRDSQTNRKASTSKSSTVVRRNSVKALTQKFVENAVETSKSEQQSSYPKAGLILRSSSFKNESTLDASDRYSEVTAEERTQKSMSVISSNSRVVSGGTFLRNKSKVTGIQDVVTRMKAEDVEVGDTSEDIEARGLLNKYLGSQAILSGIEGQVSTTTTCTARTASSSTAVKNTTKVTTVIMGLILDSLTSKVSSKHERRLRSVDQYFQFSHPNRYSTSVNIAKNGLSSLRFFVRVFRIEKFENGKEVKKTRIFEHPISNEVLETVWDEQTLRYLLEQSTDYEERKSIRARLREIMAEQEACTELVKQASQDQSGQSVDGEFLLLPLLQGLLDAPENEQTHDSGTESGEDQRSGLIAEVQNALEKLSSNLRSDTTDITPERRSSLLQLVTKLQIGLSSATSDRRHSAQMRFNRRRERPDRHTVGVSSAELADARRLIEEISCPSQSSSRTSLIPKQNSETDVDRHNCSYTAMNTVPQKFCVKNSTAKPFSSSNSASVSSTSSCVQTPSESVDCISYLFNEDNKDFKNSRESFIVHDKITNVLLPENETSDTIFTPYEINQNEVNLKDENNIGESEEEEESTVKTSDKYTNPDIIMKNNPLYYQQPKVEKTNRYTNKKQKMRRANTIDIPKPLHFYECDDEDDETDYEDEERRRRNAYLALRGPIRVGNATNKSSVPILEPKTENDRKFLAFIKKHNEKNQRHSLWAGNSDNHFKWNNQFDHLKTNFEKTIDNGPVSPNSARNFWKSSDDSMRLGSNKYDPKISKQSARNLKKMFEEKQKKCNENSDSTNIVTGSLKFAAKIDTSNNYRCMPQPLPVNKFSHAPSSAFQPVNRNSSHQEVKENFGEEPLEVIKSVMNSNDPQSSDRLFLYSPKPLQNNISNPLTTTAYIKPWIGNTGEGRVLALAAKKFENPVTNTNNSFEPKKLSKEKINVFPHYHDSSQDKLTAPYLVKSSDNKLNIVRKLSGQYDNLGSQMNKFQRVSQPPKTQDNVKHIQGFEAKFTVPQNYSIRYDKPNLPLRTQNLPFEEHRTIPSEIKKYNQMHHTGKSDQVHHYTPSYNKSSVNTQEPLQVQPNQRTVILNDSTHRTGTQSPSQIYQDSQKYSVSRENLQTTQFDPKFEYISKTSLTSKVNSGAPAQNTYNDRNVNTADNTKQRYSRQTSSESVKEYDAISSKVMSAPVAQTASTFRQKSPLTRNEHDMEAAFNLRSVLQKVSNSPSPKPQHQYSPTNVIQTKHVKVRDINIPEYSNVAFSKSAEPTKQRCQPKSSCSIPENTYRAKIVQKQFPPLSENCEVTAKGEHIVTGKFSIPTISVKPHEISFNKPSPSHVLSKSDSWHQICLINQGNLQPKPSSNSSLNSRAIMKSKSTHSMIAPKQFEAGMTKDEILEKKKTLEAFFGVNSSQPAFGSTGGKVIKRAINRTKTSEKNSQNKQSQAIGMTSGLARSRTLPDIVRPDLLDESNVDKAFEDLFSSS